MSTKEAKVAKAVTMPALVSYIISRLHGKSKTVMTKLRTCPDGPGGVHSNWDDMIACNMPKASVMDAYKREFGRKPDEIHLNDYFCKNYGWLSYNGVGDVSYHNVVIKPMSNVENERILTNNTDTPFTQEVSLGTTVSNSVTVTVTSASSVSTSDTITIGFKAFGIGNDFTGTFEFSNAEGSSSIHSTSVTITDKVTVTVQPHSTIRVYLQVEWESRTEDWKMPVEIDPAGLTAAKFSKPVVVDGRHHSIVAASHSYLFNPPFRSTIQGTLVASYNTTGQVVVEPVS